jgi:hypothetical protein
LRRINKRSNANAGGAARDLPHLRPDPLEPDQARSRDAALTWPGEPEDAPVEVNRIKVWQCIGCGRIDDPQPCVGICRDEKREYVRAEEHDAAVAEMGVELDTLRQVARELAGTTPRDGEWERNYRALQQRARSALARLRAHEVAFTRPAPRPPRKTMPTGS